MPGTLSVPERRPLSWPPPAICGASASCGFCAADEERAGALRPVELVRRQRQQVDAHRARRRSGPCRPPARRRCGAARRASCAIAPISASGWSVPISLLAAITLTRIVLGVIAARSASRSTQAVGVDAEHASRRALRARAACTTSSTDLCSVATVMTWLPRPRSAVDATPLSARLFDSVAPLVKMISRGDGVDQRGDLRARASRPRRARPSRRRAACCAGLPNRSVKNGSIASRTRGSTGVVAW